MTRTLLRDLLVALSLANLLLLKGWIELVEGVRHPYFRRDTSIYWVDCVALMLDVVLLAGVFWIGVLLARRAKKGLVLRLARGTFLGALLLLVFMVANILRRRYAFLSPDSLAARLGKPALILLGVLVIVVIVLLLLRWRAALVRAGVTVVLIFSPFVLVTFARALWLGVQHASYVGPAEEPFTGANPMRRHSARRMLWLVFDDMDYRLTISERPPQLHLPEIDRLRREALSASHAYSPAAYTGRSMPALITGKRVSKATPVRVDEMMIIFEGSSEAVGWSSQANIFSQAQEKGFRTAVIGWYHPYCRVFRNSLTTCSWMPFRPEGSDIPLVKPMVDFINQATPPMARVGLFERLGINDPDLDGEHQIRTYVRTLAEAKRVIADPTLDLVLVHWPIPHPPFVYDREQGALTRLSNSPEGYLGNLALVDRTLGELRRILEEAGLWDDSGILLTSDHPWRDAKRFDGKRDPRVPFLLKLPDYHEAITYPHAFDTVLTHDLLLALLGGEVASPERVVQWLDERVAVPCD